MFDKLEWAGERKEGGDGNTTGPRGESPRGVGFFFSFSARLAKIKTPPPEAFRKLLVINFVYAA